MSSTAHHFAIYWHPLCHALLLPYATHPFCHSLATLFPIIFHPFAVDLLPLLQFTAHPYASRTAFFLFTAHPFAFYCPPLFSFRAFLPRLYFQRKLFAVQCPPLCHSQLANPVDSAVDSRQQTPLWNASLACYAGKQKIYCECSVCKLQVQTEINNGWT